MLIVRGYMKGTGINRNNLLIKIATIVVSLTVVLSIGALSIYADDNSGASYKSVDSVTIEITPSSFTYNRRNQKPEKVTVKDGNKTLVEGTDYTLTNNGGTNAGNYYVKITGAGNYKGNKSITFKISKLGITSNMITISPSSFTYNTFEQKPVNVSVKCNGVRLKEDADYTITNNGGTNVGTYTLVVKGKGNLEGSATKQYKINKANNTITKFVAKGGSMDGSQLYSWELKSTFGAKQTVIYFSTSQNGTYKTTEPAKAGTYYMKAFIPGTNNYNEVWSEPKQFTISSAPSAGPTGQVIIRNTIANSAKKTNDVIWDKSKVKNATNYELSWRPRGASKWVSKTVGNTVRGTTTGLTIKGLYEIRVRPKNPSGAGAWSKSVYRYFHTTEKIRLSSNNKGSFTMSWKRNPDATSYQVMYTTNSNGAGAAQNINTVGASATSFTKTGLKSGVTYYVQVREIRKVGNINYIGNISCPVAVKIK